MAYALAKGTLQAPGPGKGNKEGNEEGEEAQPASSKKRGKDEDGEEVQPALSKKRGKDEDGEEVQPALSKKRKKTPRQLRWGLYRKLFTQRVMRIARMLQSRLLAQVQFRHETSSSTKDPTTIDWQNHRLKTKKSSENMRLWVRWGLGYWKKHSGIWGELGEEYEQWHAKSHRWGKGELEDVAGDKRKSLDIPWPGLALVTSRAPGTVIVIRIFESFH